MIHKLGEKYLCNAHLTGDLDREHIKTCHGPLDKKTKGPSLIYEQKSLNREEMFDTINY